VRGRRQDHDRDDQAQDVDGQALLAPGHLLPDVLPGRGRRDRGSRVDALGVQDDQGRVGLAALLLPGVPAQQVMDRLVGAVIAPSGEVVVRIAGLSPKGLLAVSAMIERSGCWRAHCSAEHPARWHMFSHPQPQGGVWWLAGRSSVFHESPIASR
jgi:hypothetical protein